jgi:hypothetical protein
MLYSSSCPKYCITKGWNYYLFVSVFFGCVVIILYKQKVIKTKKTFYIMIIVLDCIFFVFYYLMRNLMSFFVTKQSQVRSSVLSSKYKAQLHSLELMSGIFRPLLT